MLLNAPSCDATSRLRILLVEDHEDTRQMYAEFLQASFDIETAGDAPDALRKARLRPPAVVITDLSLPGMDGFELIAAMRADPALQAIPVICLSGFGGMAHEARARAAGCDRVLQKPCMPDTLAEVISTLLNSPGDRSFEG
jgi:two-component system, cell cycle response regulator DivK